MFIQDDEKDDRKAAIRKLMDMMGSETGKRLGSLKKPQSLEEERDSGFEGNDPEPEDRLADEEIREGDEDDEDDEPSDDEKAKIHELYHKYCK